MACDQTAVALLTFAPPQGKAWLHDLVDPDPTNGIMLCRKHANGTVVPMSWQLVDARDPAWTRQVVIDLAERAEDTRDERLVADNSQVGALPSDSTALDREFAALGELPITPRRYEAPRDTVSRTETQPAPADLLVMSDSSAPLADPSLFELPISDAPAVSPHPGFA